MVSSEDFETGLIRTFRRFTWVRLFFLILYMASYVFEAGWLPLTDWLFPVMMLLDVAILLIFLSIPRLEEVFQKAYLPIAILWSTIGPLIELHYVYSTFSSEIPIRANFPIVFQLNLFLCIPLVIVSWRYSMKNVIFYSAVTHFLDTGLFFMIFQSPNATNYIVPLIGITSVRTVTLFLIGNMIVNLVKVQRQQNVRLRNAYDKLAANALVQENLAISRERNRMARELHDVLAHTMSGVAIELEGVRSVLRTDSDHAEELLGQSLQAIREGLNETRRALQSLRASPIEDLGLSLAIRNLVEMNAERVGLETRFKIEENLIDYPFEVQQCFYRVAQEALTNVITHSQASRVDVSLWQEGKFLKLSVQDNGVGFDQDIVDLDHKYGLVGMQERAAMIDADLFIKSEASSGTRILLVYESKSQEALNE